MLLSRLSSNLVCSLRIRVFGIYKASNAIVNKCPRVSILVQLDQFQRCIRYLKGKGAITNEDYQRIYPTSAATPIMYGLPKVHKDGIPLRIILASTGSFNHECAKWLSDILSPLRFHSTNLKDTFSFIDEVKNLSLNDSVRYSFDVVSIFNNIPLQLTLQLILDIFSKTILRPFTT